MRYTSESIFQLRPLLGCVPYNEAYMVWDRAMFDLRMSLGSGHNIEIGCLHGNSTIPMAAAMVNIGDSFRHYAIDPFIGRSYQGAYVTSFSEEDPDCILSIFKNNIKKYDADLLASVVPVMGYSQDVFTKVQELLPFDSVAMLFIDGDHSELGVKNDVINYHRFVKVGGVIAFDDWGGFGVIQGYERARAELTGSWENPEQFAHSRVYIQRTA